MVRWFRWGTNLKSILSLTLVDVKLVSFNSWFPFHQNNAQEPKIVVFFWEKNQDKVQISWISCPLIKWTLTRIMMILLSLFMFHFSHGSEFVRREGSRLMLGEEVFTFSGVNIYWLGQVIDNIKELSKYHMYILRMKTTPIRRQESSPYIPILQSSGE